MERKTKPYDLHVLVCTNTRANSEKKSCGPLGAETVREELKEWLRAEVAKRTPASDFVNTSVKPLKGRVKCRVNGSGCLDFCSNGIVIAIYPFGEFLLNVDRSNLDEVKALLISRLNELERSAPADF